MFLRRYETSAVSTSVWDMQRVLDFFKVGLAVQDRGIVKIRHLRYMDHLEGCVSIRSTRMFESRFRYEKKSIRKIKFIF